MHPPKHETFDLRARTNTDPKGIVRAADEYTVQPGVYLARPTPGRAQFHYLESWLLPSLGLRVTVFHFNAGYERDQDYYLDVGEYTPGTDEWTSEDHYLDLVVRTQSGGPGRRRRATGRRAARPFDARDRRTGGPPSDSRHRRPGSQSLRRQRVAQRRRHAAHVALNSVAAAKLDGKQAVEELPVVHQRHPQIFSGGLLSPSHRSSRRDRA